MGPQLVTISSHAWTTNVAVMYSVPPTKLPLIQNKDKKKSKESHEDKSMNQGGERGFSWLTGLGFAFLTFNSGMAIYRSDGDRSSVAFVVVSYLDLLLLFLCLRLFEDAPRDSRRRAWLKAFVWGLTTLLTAMFSHKVAAVMPTPVAVVVWVMAFATIGGGFYAFFVHQEKPDQVE